MNLEQKQAAIRHIIDNKTKPVGALGELEKVAVELALLSPNDQFQQISVDKPEMLVFQAIMALPKKALALHLALSQPKWCKTF